MKYTTEEGLRKVRAIAERAYVRGSATCKVSTLALLAMLDEIKAAEQSAHLTRRSVAKKEPCPTKQPVKIARR